VHFTSRATCLSLRRSRPTCFPPGPQARHFENQRQPKAVGLVEIVVHAVQIFRSEQLGKLKSLLGRIGSELSR
jgi:hypothetical protein